MKNKKLIYANEALEKLCEYCGCGNYEECDFRCSEFENISNIPAVDAVPVVHGRWLFVTKGQQTSVFVCSECNVAISLSCDEDKIEKKLKQDHPYCRCGAKMDGGNADA